MVLLYADVLGMKARWKRGVDEVLESYRALETLVASVVRRAAVPVQGGVQSDALALALPNAVAAIEVGARLFRRCFEEATENRRLWLRGLIVPFAHDPSAMVNEVALDAGGSAELSTRHFSRPLLDAVNLEQQFKGPRLLIDLALVDQDTKDRVAIQLGDRFIVPVKHLWYSGYPASHDGLADVLYLTPPSFGPRPEEDVLRRGRQVSRRMRWASGRSSNGSEEELRHLASLVSTWMETEAIIRDVMRRA